MSIQTFEGMAKWAKVRKPDPEYDQYAIDLYFTEKSYKDYEKSGLRLKVKTDDDGKYVTFKRKVNDFAFGKAVVNDPPTVYLKDAQSGEYAKWAEGLIGNGSKVQIAVDIYPTKNGPGHRLMRVFVDDLVIYESGPKTEPQEVNLPF